MRMASALRESCKWLSGERSNLICSILIDIEKEVDLRIVLEKIELAMAYTLPAIEVERKEILDRLRNIQFCISNLNISSGSARRTLYELKTSIRSVQDKMVAQELNMDDLSKVLKERDYAMIERLEKMRDDWLKSVEKMAQDLPSCDDTEGILKEVQGLKQSKRRDILGITGDISSIAGLFIGMMGLAVTLKPV
jgi:chromosome segregation ATPase